MQASERASMRVSSSVLFSPLSSSLLFFGALLSTRRQAACSRQAVRERPSVASVFQRRRCLFRLGGVVEYFFLASGEKVSVSRQMLKDFLCSQTVLRCGILLR